MLRLLMKIYFKKSKTHLKKNNKAIVQKVFIKFLLSLRHKNYSKYKKKFKNIILVYKLKSKKFL